MPGSPETAPDDAARAAERISHAGDPDRNPPATAPAPAVIIIFGAAVRPDGSPSPALRQRVEAAARFATRLTAPYFIPTGGQGRYGEPECVVMARLLAACGVPPGRIIQEATATDTLSSVRAVARLLRARGMTGPAYAASSAYHLPRCVLLLRAAGIPARPATPPSERAAPSLLRRWYWRLREVPAIPYDLLLAIGLRILHRL